jgi:hypothetical protein
MDLLPRVALSRHWVVSPISLFTKVSTAGPRIYILDRADNKLIILNNFTRLMAGNIIYEYYKAPRMIRVLTEVHIGCCTVLWFEGQAA